MKSPEGLPDHNSEGLPAKSIEQFQDEFEDFEWEIRTAREFDELFAALETARVIEGSKQTYPSDILENIIKSLISPARENDFEDFLSRFRGVIELVPEDHGIRAKVIELLQRESKAVERERRQQEDLDEAKGETLEFVQEAVPPDYAEMSLEELSRDKEAAPILLRKMREFYQISDSDLGAANNFGDEDAFAAALNLIRSPADHRQIMQLVKRELLNNPNYTQPWDSQGML